MDTAADHVTDLPTSGMGKLGARMGIEILEASPERVVGTMPVEGNTHLRSATGFG
jgi:hypothetical protein